MYFIDLFCGAGGLSTGLEMAGHKCILGIDHDRQAINTFKENHPEARAICGDVGEFARDDVFWMPKIDLIVGGPPCQGLSSAGKGRPNDERNYLYQDYFAVVKKFKPSYFLIENVPGLLSKKNTHILQGIKDLSKQLGYNLSIMKLNAADYGVPQNRQRVIIFGAKWHKDGTGNLDLDLRTPKVVGDVLDDLKSYSPPALPNHDIARASITKEVDYERIQQIPEGKGIRYQKDEDNYLSKNLKLDVNWDELPENRLRQTKYQRLDRSTQSPTIMTSRTTYYHPTEHRYLTVREAASIQGFPVQFKFLGSLTAQWKQVGNSVPPLLAKAIGEALNNVGRINICL